MSHCRNRVILLSVVAVLAVFAAACAPAATPVPTSAPPPTPEPTLTEAPTFTLAPATMTAPAPTTAPTHTATNAPAWANGKMAALAAAAKQEGELTVIALQDTWCNYGEMKKQFYYQYGIKINDLNPNGSSGQEIQAIIANKDNKGAQAPDVIDVGLAFGPQVVEQKLVAAYQVAMWDEIPDAAKDRNGYWYGGYYGVMAFEVNSDIATSPPQDWADLLKPEYKNSVALSGDPRRSAQAVQSVFAAGLAADGGDISKAGDAGLNFFAQLNKVGNLVPVVGSVETVASGETPFRIQWDYLSLTDRDRLDSNPRIDTIVPKSGVVAGLYVQAISAYAPHPNAARLWMEYLYSDEGQQTWLKGYCHPIRFNAMVRANTIPADLLAKLPPAENYAKVVFPTLDQQAAYKDTITKNWDSVVGANVRSQ